MVITVAPERSSLPAAAESWTTSSAARLLPGTTTSTTPSLPVAEAENCFESLPSMNFIPWSRAVGAEIGRRVRRRLLRGNDDGMAMRQLAFPSRDRENGQPTL